jgi:alpha-methylacyl-CoA racemase
MSSRLHEFLRGVRVLDLSRHLPGPLATLMLADMGAEVIKIEAPSGDEMREWGPRDDEGRAVMFEAVNAGKLLKKIDLKAPEGREALFALVDRADVLVESFRPGVLDRLGVGHEVLCKRNPRLVYCALSGYGQTGPLRDVAGHDVNYLSRSGLLHSNGPVEAPSLISPPLADCTASMVAVTSILGALHARTADGQGCFIDIALADVCAPLNLFALADLGLTGKPPERGGHWLNGGWARYRIYETADGGHVSLGAVEHKFWKAFCLASGMPQWIGRYDDAAPQQALTTEVGDHLRSLTLAQCMAIYGAADCCFTAVDDLAVAAESAHTHARGLVRRHPSMHIYEAAFPARIDGDAPDLRAALKPCDD